MSTAKNKESKSNENNSSDEIDVSRLTFSTIALITDDVFEKMDIELHGAILILNELIRSEDTSSWYFLDKVHEHYFESKEKWTEYLQKISPNKPLDIHDIRSQIMNGEYGKNDEQRLLNDIGSVFTNAMVRYEEEEDDESNNDEDNDYYDEAQRILTKFQTLCSEMEKQKEKEQQNESKENMEDSDNEIVYGSTDNVFEIEDYYCASPWERLISEIEKQCMAWNIHKGSEECAVEYRQQMTNNCVLSANITISNSDYNYILEYHDYTDFIDEIQPIKNNKNKNDYKYFTRSMHEIISRERDPSIICSNCHELCAWFGISRFLLLLPGNSNIDYIDESECMFMCSTLSIAVFNIECSLSYFVPFGDQWDMSFRGGLRFNRFNTTYVCKSQRSIPQICEYLDGIFKVFKRHLRLYYDESDAMLTMAHSDYNPLYRIYGFCSFKYLYDPSTNILALLNHNWRDLMADDIISYGIRWGPTYSPLKSLSLQTIWTYFPEGAFIDNMAHSDLNPYHAPKWTLTAVWDELSSKKLQSEAYTPLTKALVRLLVIARDLVEDSDIVWRDIIASSAIKQQDMVQIMNEKREKNQHHHQNNENAADTGKKLLSPKHSKHPLFEDFIQQNVLKSDLYSSTTTSSIKEEKEGNEVSNEYFVKSECMRGKSPPISSPKCAPFGSLMSIFVLRLFEIDDIDIGHIGDVWYKFTYEVSLRWTDCELLPGVYGLPDFRTCLLHQKLQLLNECIRRKLQQRKYMKFKAEKLRDSKSPIFSPIYDDDINKKKKKEKCVRVAEGVERQHPYLYLLNDCETRINIPLTQDHPIFTADKLEAHYEELVSLGSSMDASKQRAEIQSTQLKGDMMAFKAANPNCVLEDFIRWYSPNDWIVDIDDDKPKISDQMSEEIVYFDSDSNDNDNDNDDHGNGTGSNEEEDEMIYSDDILSSSDSSAENVMKIKKKINKKGIKTVKKDESKRDKLTKKGTLSARMSAEDNIWCRAWEEAEAIPAMEQELLFDFDVEGNEALKWIMNLQPTDTMLQLTQIGVGNAVSILERTPGVERKLVPLTDMIVNLKNNTKKIWKLDKQSNQNYLDLDVAIKGWAKELRLAEMGCACGAALTFKFNAETCKQMIERLMIQPYSSQVMSMKEKEAVLAIIGHRIYEDGINGLDEDSDDSQNNDEDGDEGQKYGFWSWGSSPKTKSSNDSGKLEHDRKNSIVIFDDDDMGTNDKVKEKDENSDATTKSMRKGRRYKLPKPTSKQYNVVACAPRPHPDSQATPNRMHVTIDQYGFKMALATTTVE